MEIFMNIIINTSKDCIYRAMVSVMVVMYHCWFETFVVGVVCLGKYFSLELLIINIIIIFNFFFTFVRTNQILYIIIYISLKYLVSRIITRQLIKIIMSFFWKLIKNKFCTYFGMIRFKSMVHGLSQITHTFNLKKKNHLIFINSDFWKGTLAY